MTLNAVIALILRFFPNLTDFQADYITVVVDRPIMSVKYCLPVPVFYTVSKKTTPMFLAVTCDSIVGFS